MIIKRKLNSETLPPEGLTIDGKHISEFSEREIDNIRRRVANILRNQAINGNHLVYIINSIVLAYGKYGKDYTEKTLDL